MRRIIAGNWKMNGLRAALPGLVDPLLTLPRNPSCEVVICPPATLLALVASRAQGSAVEIGGQDCHPEPHGPHTGDISAEQLRDAGASWVILGHSERRSDHGETDALVREKVAAATAAGLTAIVCVGETAEQRSAGEASETVGWQISGSLPDGFAGVVAYEPVWAIGSGRVAEAEDIHAMHAFIRAELLRQLGEAGRDVPILYGGSVKVGNCAELFSIPEVAGALVGGASLVAAEFRAIVEGAATLSKATAGG